jgi:hypothetical protein
MRFEWAKITATNAGGLRQHSIRTPWAARVGEFACMTVEEFEALARARGSTSGTRQALPFLAIRRGFELLEIVEHAPSDSAFSFDTDYVECLGLEELHRQFQSPEGHHDDWD